MSKFNINFMAYSLREDGAQAAPSKQLASVVYGRVAQSGVTLQETTTGKQVARVMVSAKDCTFNVKSALKALGLAENAIEPFKNGDVEYWPIRITLWNQNATNIAKAVKAGDFIRVTGPLTVDSFTGNDGVVRHSLNVTAYAWEKDFNNAKTANTNQNVQADQTPVTPQPVSTTEAVQEVTVDTEDFAATISSDDLPW